MAVVDLRVGDNTVSGVEGNRHLVDRAGRNVPFVAARCVNGDVVDVTFRAEGYVCDFRDGLGCCTTRICIVGAADCWQGGSPISAGVPCRCRARECRGHGEDGQHHERGKEYGPYLLLWC
ncbi:hypothetical protein HTIA_0851 [Halorhabdus tiamatea SARL4B]|uniref:Uncharacterized protein n=1 Tax=Halorhabdus tiamatea SARL4B TaxID=1033806 RepID=S6D7W6_9EURY|nr:hypothetical protein HTIA_0851 [Halorhabdus tiamatea SARL4B]